MPNEIGMIHKLLHAVFCIVCKDSVYFWVVERYPLPVDDLCWDTYRGDSV